MQAVRICWGPRRTGIFNLQWDAINHQSLVLIGASEGREGVDVDGDFTISSASPDRFVGHARFTVDNIAPHDGGVTFRVTIDWDPDDRLTLWTDILLFDDVRSELVIAFP